MQVYMFFLHYIYLRSHSESNTHTQTIPLNIMCYVDTSSDIYSYDSVCGGWWWLRRAAVDTYYVDGMERASERASLTTDWLWLGLWTCGRTRNIHNMYLSPDLTTKECVRLGSGLVMYVWVCMVGGMYWLFPSLRRWGYYNKVILWLLITVQPRSVIVVCTCWHLNG